MTKATIFYKNDSSVGLQFETYEMQIPDFRQDWTETEQMFNEFAEEKRKEIKELYSGLHGENPTQVLFQWEIDELELQLSPIEEDTYNGDGYGRLSIEEKYGTIEDNNEGYDEWADAYKGPSQVPKPGYVLCYDGLYRPQY